MRLGFVGAAWSVILMGTAFAQVQPAQLVGSWQADTGSMTGPCTVELRNATGMSGLSAASQFCMGQLMFLNGWQPDSNGVTLLGLNGSLLGTLSVSGGKLQGRMADGTIISMTPMSGQTLASQPTGNCIYNPESGYCADAGEVAVPTAFPVTVKALHPLNIRQQPTSQSASLGQIAEGECFVIDQCTNTNEGVRCHIKAGSGIQEGWASKHFVQEGRMFVGFQNFC
jgi:hypothetical protein